MGFKDPVRGSPRCPFTARSRLPATVLAFLQYHPGERRRARRWRHPRNIRRDGPCLSPRRREAGLWPRSWPLRPRERSVSPTSRGGRRAARGRRRTDRDGPGTPRLRPDPLPPFAGQVDPPASGQGRAGRERATPTRPPRYTRSDPSPAGKTPVSDECEALASREYFVRSPPPRPARSYLPPVSHMEAQPHADPMRTAGSRMIKSV